jgi:hypothetical protein
VLPTRSETFAWDPAARPATDFTGNTAGGAGGLWTATPTYRWIANPPGTSLRYVIPLADPTVVVGAGAFTALVSSSGGDIDLQVTISELRPDGHETFVQSGWLRTSQRKLDPRKSSELEPILSRRAKDVAPLPKGKLTELTIPLYYQGHAYRAGSSLVATLSAPGGDQPVWAFGDVPKRKSTVLVDQARLTLPVVGGIAIPTPLPPCPGLRGEPCR